MPGHHERGARGGTGSAASATGRREAARRRYGPSAGAAGPVGAGRRGGAAASGAAGRRRWNPRKAVFTGLLVLGVVGVVGWLLFGSRLLMVREIDIVGGNLLSRERVLSAARVPPGTSLLRIDVEEVRGRLESVREVESAAVTRVWPAGLRISLRERTPVAVAAAQEGHLHLDRYGVTVLTSPIPQSGLPLLVVADPREGDPATRAALTVLVGLPRDITARLSSIEAPSTESVTLRLGSGPAVMWGAPERTGEKLRALRALLGSARGRTAEQIDVSSPEVVSTR